MRGRSQRHTAGITVFPNGGLIGINDLVTVGEWSTKGKKINSTTTTFWEQTRRVHRASRHTKRIVQQITWTAAGWKCHLWVGLSVSQVWTGCGGCRQLQWLAAELKADPDAAICKVDTGQLPSHSRKRTQRPPAFACLMWHK